MKSWKTTLGGALVMLGASIGQIYPQYAKEGAMLAAIGTAFGLVFARDNNVSSEQAGANNHTPKAPPAP
jgi:hypothetical protein